MTRNSHSDRQVFPMALPSSTTNPQAFQTYLPDILPLLWSRYDFKSWHLASGAWERIEFEMLVLPRDVPDLNLRVVRDKKFSMLPKQNRLRRQPNRAMHTGDLEKRAPSNDYNSVFISRFQQGPHRYSSHQSRLNQFFLSNNYILTSTFAYLLHYRIHFNPLFNKNYRYLRLSQPIQFEQRISTQSLCFPPLLITGKGC